jgi:hypothetical protein
LPFPPFTLHAAGFTAAFTPSIVTWLFAPYDSWTSTTLFDRRFLFYFTPLFIHSPFVRCQTSADHKPKNKRLATISDTSATAPTPTGFKSCPVCDFRYHK